MFTILIKNIEYESQNKTILILYLDYTQKLKQKPELIKKIITKPPQGLSCGTYSMYVIKSVV